MQETPLSPSLEPADCNCQALRQAARRVTQAYDTHLALVGLKTTQYSILAKLNRLGPLSINELAKLMVMDRTTLGRAVKPLERDRLLAIGADDDGRKRSLKLTAAGQARLKAATAKKLTEISMQAHTGPGAKGMSAAMSARAEASRQTR